MSQRGGESCLGTYIFAKNRIRTHFLKDRMLSIRRLCVLMLSLSREAVERDRLSEAREASSNEAEKTVSKAAC